LQHHFVHGSVCRMLLLQHAKLGALQASFSPE